MKTKKSLQGLLIVLLMITPVFRSNAQEAMPKTFTVYPYVGIGIGFFYPTAVNDYIEDVILSGYTSEVNTELYVYYELKGGVTFRMKKAELNAGLEYDIAPKLVMVSNGENVTYSYSRVAPEISAKYFFPNASGKNAFFVEGGISYSFLKFKKFNASAPGFKAQAGYSLQFSRLNIQPYGAFRYVKGTDDSFATESPYLQTDFELSYTGFQIGVVLSFHQRMLYN